MGGRIDLEPDHVFQSFRQQRVTRELECADAVRREAVGGPDALHRSQAQARSPGHHPPRPVRGLSGRFRQGQSSTEDDPLNLMYGGVLAVGIIGAVIVRFQPHGMVRALVGMALAQALVAVIALIFGWGSGGANWPQVIVVLNGFFAALWLGSAWLFRRAAREQTPAAAAT